MRTRVTRSFTFEAAHHLPFHPGKCHRVHGHHYQLEVTVEGPVGPDGMVVDFEVLSDVVERNLLESWDHRLLNEIVDNPTAELLAAEAWKRLEEADLDLVRLRLWETPRDRVEISRE